MEGRRKKQGWVVGKLELRYSPGKALPHSIEESEQMLSIRVDSQWPE